jgi:HAD superfamily hydrolase (TIGR01484 family)
MKKLIAFDLDDTLAITKSPITDRMSELLEKLLVHYDVCVITGGSFEQIKKQVASRLEVEDLLLRKLHLMPTCGTRYYRYHESKHEWEQQYAEDLSPTQKKKIIETLEEAAKKLNLWEANPAGEIIEDRGSQITYSALGQQASPEDKYAWDQDGTKKHAIRDYVAERLDDLEVRVGGTTSVDVTTIGIDKAYGMKKLIEALGISKEEILFIGDKLEEGGNDYPVKAFGIDTIAVDGWQDTALVLEGILAIS